MDKEKIIVLSPSVKQWLADEFYMIVLVCVGLLLSGYEDKLVSVCSLIMTAGVSLYLLGRFWFYKSVKWEISRTQIKIVKGILRRDTNFVELYRIIDYAEQQSFIQQIMGLKDVYIMSSDRTEPILRIFGISNGIDIISELKPLVKQSRIDNHIYEIANN